MTLVSAILALGFLIFIHELGHFLVAKKAGVGVKVFSLGFGARLFGFKKAETDYRLSAVPLGGYVRMVGEHPGEDVDPGEEHRSFSHKPLLWRMAIVGAGPASNLALAFVLYYLVLVAWGIPTLTTRVGMPLAGKPAAVAGVQKGDKVLAINGKPLKDWGEMVAAIQNNGPKPLEMLVDREGTERTLVITPKEVTVKDMFGEQHKVYQVGIQASQERVTRDVSLGDALGQAATLTYNAGKLIFVSILKLVQRKVSMDNMGGPILIAQAASEAARHGLAPFSGPHRADFSEPRGAEPFAHPGPGRGAPVLFPDRGHPQKAGFGQNPRKDPAGGHGAFAHAHGFCVLQRHRPHRDRRLGVPCWFWLWIPPFPQGGRRLQKTARSWARCA